MGCRIVDDNTALAVFVNPAAASEALQRAEGSKFNVRAYAEVQTTFPFVETHNCVGVNSHDMMSLSSAFRTSIWSEKPLQHYPFDVGMRLVQAASSIGIATGCSTAGHLSSHCAAPDWRSPGRPRLARQGDSVPYLSPADVIMERTFACSEGHCSCL